MITELSLSFHSQYRIFTSIIMASSVLARVLCDSARWATIIVAIVGSYTSLHMLYNLYLHPLRAFPGPVANRATVLPKLYHLVAGNLPYYVANVHEQYGPVVRIAPNELAFRDPRAWKDIYTRKPRGAYELPHDMAFYNPPNGPSTSIMNCHREQHDSTRKILNAGFSERAMRTQEPVIGGYVDLLMWRLRGLHTDSAGAPRAIDMRDWIAYTTFDMIGTLAFGSDFGCLNDGAYHPWIGLIMGSLKDVVMLHVLKALGVLPAALWLMGKFGLGDKARQMHVELTTVKTKQRLKMGTGREDFLNGLIESGMGLKELMSNGGILIIAGSETTSTLLTGAVFLLTTHPDVLDKLALEVRGQFKSSDEITLTSVNSLSYMLAVLNESLRHYPPVAISAPRVVPAEGAEIAGCQIPPGTVVGVWQWAMYHDSTMFADPHRFDPERFVQSGKGSGSKYADDRLDCVNPFLVGPRNCIGQTLAYAEMRLVLARLIWEFDIAICEESKGWLEDQRNYVLWDKPVLNVHLRPVKR